MTVLPFKRPLKCHDDEDLATSCTIGRLRSLSERRILRKMQAADFIRSLLTDYGSLGNVETLIDPDATRQKLLEARAKIDRALAVLGAWPGPKPKSRRPRE
jgi:hypothetical protein